MIPFKANSPDTEAPFSDLNLSISNSIMSSQDYDKSVDFDDELEFSFFFRWIYSLITLQEVYTSPLSRLTRVSCYVSDFNNQIKELTATYTRLSTVKLFFQMLSLTHTSNCFIYIKLARNNFCS